MVSRSIGSHTLPSMTRVTTSTMQGICALALIALAFALPGLAGHDLWKTHDAIGLVQHCRGLRIANVVGGMPYQMQIARLQNANLVVATPVDEPPLAPAPGRRRWWAAFAEGVVVQLANPKAAVFMIAFYPQFVPADRPLFVTTAWLALLQVVLETALYLALAAGVARAAPRTPRSRPGGRPRAGRRPRAGARA